ncbi:MAG: YebC/PmpR family DNA-binding transcriptional regulator [Patescibacteria group bacterium]|nr:YebC/PmpR family DNA-binding transcriptional regulator [Patescibacteria group bacterium]
MSGHSKWSTIKNKKGAADAKRAANFTRLAREIEVAARGKGPNPDMNFQLRLAIDRARASNMPKDNIERAITRGSGGAGESIIEELVYEAYAPGGTALIIECVSDNRNRTGNEVKLILSKNGGSLAGQGAVTYLFDQKGIIRTNLIPESARDDVEMELIESGAEDIAHEEEGSVIVSTPADLSSINDAATKVKLNITSAGLEWIPKSTIPIDSDVASKVAEIIAKLEEHDDITNVYTNAE